MSGSATAPPALLLALIAMAGVGLSPPAWADPDPATPADRAAVEACLALVDANAEKRAQAAVEDEKPGPEGRLAMAASDAVASYDSCIGAVTVPCQQAPGGSSTLGWVACNERELAVWDERLNRIYKEALKDAEADLATALRKTQRAWLAWRDARCHLPSIDNAGGSAVGPLTSACLMETTARQALWLEHRE